MSDLIIERAHKALTLGEIQIGNKINQPQGNLQGRKVVPLAFYLHTTGAVLGGVASVALVIAALVLSMYILHIVAAACAIICISNALGAHYVHRQVSGNDLIDKLTKKIHKYYEAEVKRGNEKEDFKIDELGLEDNLPKGIEDELDRLTNQMKLLEQLKNTVIDYNKKIDKASLEKNLNAIEESFKKRDEDTTIVERMKETLKAIDLENEEDLGNFFEKFLSNNNDLIHQFSDILEKLKNHNEVINKKASDLENIADLFKSDMGNRRNSMEFTI